MRRHLLLFMAVILTAVPTVTSPVAANRAEGLLPDASTASRNAANGCSSNALPQVIHLAQGELLEAGIPHLVKGPLTAIAETFPQTIWEGQFGASSNWVALVIPSEDIAWPPDTLSVPTDPDALDPEEIQSTYNAWRIIEGWRGPFLMFSPLENPIDTVSLGLFEANYAISAQALDHLNHVYNDQERHAWIYLVRSDGSEQLLGLLEIDDPAHISVIVPEPGEVQIRTHDSTVWWTQCLPPPAIAATKTPNPDSLPEPGGEVEFTVRVSNASPLPLTLTSLNDDVYGNIAAEDNPLVLSTDCTVAQTLPVGGHYACHFTAELLGNAGDSETNTVTALARDSFHREVAATGSATVTIVDVPPSLTVTKVADPISVPEPGGPIDFAIRVENGSPEAVVLTSLYDDVYHDITDGNNPLIGSTTCEVTQTLDVGGSYECTFSGEVWGSPGDRQTDTVTAKAQDDESNEVTAWDDAFVDVTDVPSAIKVTKTADPSHVPEPGASVSFAVLVENVSAVDHVTIDSILDDQFGDMRDRCVQSLPVTLAPAEALTCALTAHITGQPGDTHTNEVTASGIDDDGFPVSDSDSEVVIIDDVPSVIQVVKTATPSWMYYPGGDVTYGFAVHNLAPVDTVTIHALTDTVYGDLNGRGDCSLPQVLSVGSSYTCSFAAHVAGEPDTAHTNVVTATGTDDDGQEVSDSDSAAVAIVAVPTSVELLYFRAFAQGDRIVVEWETDWEQNSWGFDLYRGLTSSLEDAAWLQFEHATGSGPFEGQRYRYEDGDVIPGQTYYYWLEEVVMVGNSTRYGPVLATQPYRVYLPLAVR